MASPESFLIFCSFVCSDSGLFPVQFLLIYNVSRCFSSGNFLNILPDHRIAAAKAATCDAADMRAE